jgi:hypothetical protein
MASTWDSLFVIVVAALLVVFSWWFLSFLYPVSRVASVSPFDLVTDTPNTPVEREPIRTKQPTRCSRGEAICREVLETRYGVTFPRKRPKWLINPETGRRLELDCYSKQLRIAVEYNGKQHYEWPNMTGQKQEEFIAQVRRDMLKEKICKRRGVHLIVVPYTVPHHSIKSYILERLPP